MASLTFKELKAMMDANLETILALGESEDGGIKVVHNYGEGTQHTVSLSVAIGHKLSNRNGKFLWVKAL